MTEQPLSRSATTRNLVYRADGRQVNVARKQGHLFFCVTGCCCGLTDRGFAAVPADLYHEEWERRKLRNKVHLTQAGCLGPCTLANVAMLMFDGRTVWLHSINSERQVLAIYDYLDSMLAANAYLPLPPALADYGFQVFDHELRQSQQHTVQPPVVQTLAGQPGILFLSHSDTDLLLLSKVVRSVPDDFPPVRWFNPHNLRSAADVDAYLAQELPRAEVIVLRLLGGPASFGDGFARLVELCRTQDKFLICLPGTEAPDPEMTAASTVAAPVVHELFSYLQLGGKRNYEHALRFLADHLLFGGFGFDAPAPEPRDGVYYRTAAFDPTGPTVGVLFYRAHALSGNLEFVDALVRTIESRGANVVAVYSYSLKDVDESGKPTAFNYLSGVDVVLSTMSFAIGGVNPDGPTLSGWSVDALTSLDVPVIQAITANSGREQWESSLRGLNPIDVAMNVALPEFDGRIIGVPISFKEEVAPANGTDALRYVPVADRIERTVDLALRFVALRRKPNSEKRIAFVFTNSPTKAARIGNAVGLDAPASLLRLFDAMRAAGYQIGGVPETGDELLHALIDRCSYDLDFLTEQQLASASALVPASRYAAWHRDLPERNQREMDGRWGLPPGSAYVHDDQIALAGLRFGNAFVALQPPRGYGMDPNAIYHVPDLPPPHHYHALYRWLRDPAGFGADAIVHVGKHGTLEWLPGKGVGVSATCYPDQFLSDLPLIYPFIINDPGEGSQAKRRTHAVVIDHMTPPMTEAGAYGELAELAQLVDEYYQVEQMDPGKLPLLQQQIWDQIKSAKLDSDIKSLINYDSEGANHTHEWDDELTPEGTPVSLADMRGKDFAHLLENIDGYICELASSQIRDGLHTLGEVLAGEQLVDMLVHLVRLPNLDVPSLRSGVADALGFDLRAAQEQPGKRLDDVPSALAGLAIRPIVSNADAIEEIDRLVKALLSRLAGSGFDLANVPAVLKEVLGRDDMPTPVRTLEFVCRDLVPNLQRNVDEIENLIRALDGRYVPAGPSGAPSRGMAHVLPTGRNFYAVDPRSVPSLAAWRVGSQLALEVLERHLSEEGRYPERVGISVWGTSAMRTHGDDIAEVFALLGVRPVWQPENRRLIGVAPIPLAELGRPRIDVVCRISGFFRDAFPHLINLVDEAVRMVADLDEPDDQNFVRKHVLAEERRRSEAGEPIEPARYRVFGSKPGSYGAGILPLIDEHNWKDDADLAAVYVEWGGYAYTAETFGVDARETFRKVLAGITVAIKNQDNREHDIFDSDDYFQFHGGMIATVRALTGRSPKGYFGDNSNPDRARVRDLKEEAKRVFRSRVVNPKWIASVKRHGFKGALELAATVDYLFGYDATSDVVEDWMYERLTAAYLFDRDTREFMERSNPWALRGIAERLLEAMDRSLWVRPNAETRRKLESMYLDVESSIEARQETVRGG